MLAERIYALTFNIFSLFWIALELEFRIDDYYYYLRFESSIHRLHINFAQQEAPTLIILCNHEVKLVWNKPSLSESHTQN